MPEDSASHTWHDVCETSRLPRSATHHHRISGTKPTLDGYDGIFLIRYSGRVKHPTLNQNLSFGRLVPSAVGTAIGELPLTENEFLLDLDLTNRD